MEVSVENRGADVERVLLRDSPPRLSEVARGSTTLLSGLKSGEKATLRYELGFREPGEYSFGSCSVKAESMFGLAEKTSEFKIGTAVRVYPRRLVKTLDPGPARPFGWSGATPSRFKGGRLEYMSMRAYVPGDPLKDVNWKASARLARTLVNERRVERGLDCIVTVDLSSESLPRVGGWSGRADVITASYELASTLIRSGDRVGMMVVGRVLKKIGPGFGPRHLKVMVENLVDSQEGDVWSMKHTELFLEMFYRKQYKLRGGTLFFVFAWPSQALFDTVVSLADKGFACNSLLVDTLESEEAALEGQRVLKPGEAQFGRRFAAAERESFRAMLAPYSNVYLWRKGEGLVEPPGRAGA